MTQHNETSDESVADNSGAQEKEVIDKAEYDKLKAAHDALEQQYKSQKGRQQVRVSGPDITTAITENTTEMRRIRRQLLEASEISDAEKKAGMDAIDTEDRASADQAAFVRSSNRIADRIYRDLERAEIPTDHPSIVAIEEKWDSAKTIEAREDISDEISDFIEAERARKAKEASDTLETAKQEYNRETGSLEMGTPGQGRAVTSAKTWDQA